MNTRDRLTASLSDRYRLPIPLRDGPFRRNIRESPT